MRNERQDKTRQPLLRKAIKSVGDATGVIPELAIQLQHIGKGFRRQRNLRGDAFLSDAMETSMKAGFGSAFGSIRRFLLPLSSRYHENQKKRKDNIGVGQELMGSITNLIGDLVILAGGVASGGFVGFLIYKGITNLAALWTADLYTDLTGKT